MIAIIVSLNVRFSVQNEYASFQISRFGTCRIIINKQNVKLKNLKNKDINFLHLLVLALVTMFRRLLSFKPVLILPWKNFSITNVMSINKARTKVVINAPSKNFWDRRDWLSKQIWTIFFVFGCGTTAIVTSKCSPHTILIHVTRDTFQQKIEQKPVELSDMLKGVITNTLKGENFHESLKSSNLQ